MATEYDWEQVKQDLDEGLHKIQLRLDKTEVELKRKSGMVIVGPPGAYSPETQEQKTFSSYLRHGEKQLGGAEVKTLRVADAALGGYWSPPEFSDQVIGKLTEWSPVRQVAGIMQTSGAYLEIPKQSGQFDAGWTGELSERTETTGFTTALERIEPKECYAFVKVSRQLLEDSSVNLDAFLIQEFGQRFNKVEGTAFISGANTTEPEGILVNANVTSENSGDGSNLTPDGLVGLVYSLPSEYRKRAVWLMNRSTILAARLLKDGQNNYLWQPSFAAGQPETLLGYPVYEAVDMPDVSNASYPVVFGDMKRAYLIVDRIGMSVQRLTERYAEYGIVAFMGRKRVAGQVVLAEAIKKLKIAT
jgi:HK97 family phage major capsid protein